jgi:hypothetical protein
LSRSKDFAAEDCPSQEETIGQVETLVSELRAINYWDSELWRHKPPDWNEMVAFLSRQKRRSEIIRQLLRLAKT